MKFHFIICIAAIIVLSASAIVASAEDAAEFHQKGIAALKESQEKPESIVAAARCFAKAAAMYDTDGKTELAVEMNSYLYWCKKKMTLKDIDAFVKSENATVSTRLTTVETNPAASSDAQAWLDRADTFARANPGELLLIAVRYFEVADRFKGTDIGLKATDASLKAMQKIGEKQKLAEYQPTASDGKVFVQSDPSGASIIILLGREKRDSGKKTPALISIPKGRNEIVLELKDWKPSKIEVTVTDSILKPDAVKLDPVTVSVDLIFEEGWMVYVDNLPLKGSDGKQLITPCTAPVPLGNHTIAVAKDGFWDISQRMAVKEATQLEFKQKPSRGKSVLLSLKKEFDPVGVWHKGATNVSDMSIAKDHTLFMFQNSGKWEIKDGKFIVTWNNKDWGVETFDVKDNDRMESDHGSKMFRAK